MFKYTVLDRFVPNCRDLQPHNLPNNPPINQHNRYVTLPFVMYLSVFADSFRYSLNISNALLMNRISLLSLFISIITHVTANSPTFPPTQQVDTPMMMIIAFIDIYLILVDNFSFFVILFFFFVVLQSTNLSTFLPAYKTAYKTSYETTYITTYETTYITTCETSIVFPID